ncbi:HAMP domain-containing protein [Mycobacterium tuberculosis]|uniref:HAMP domain-containing protein n=1 Tax=Mycobacterium tuberculosis TaxID=1773 RepID=UPI00272C2413|nr:DegT/DnrJ/EryC1/StrS family aminotransferase [Mycobacterium tuberculosis]
MNGGLPLLTLAIWTPILAGHSDRAGGQPVDACAAGLDLRAAADPAVSCAGGRDGFRWCPRPSQAPNATTRLPSPFLLRQSRMGTIEIVEPAAIDGALSAALLAMPLPAYTASVRQADGRWLVIEPVQPFLGGWQRSILIALAVSLLMLAPLAWIFARRLTRPFRALAGAHASRLAGRHAGTFGIAGSFSFYPTKVMTSAEGGVLVPADTFMATATRCSPPADGRC